MKKNTVEILLFLLLLISYILFCYYYDPKVKLLTFFLGIIGITKISEDIIKSIYNDSE